MGNAVIAQVQASKLGQPQEPVHVDGADLVVVGKDVFQGRHRIEDGGDALESVEAEDDVLKENALAQLRRQVSQQVVPAKRKETRLRPLYFHHRIRNKNLERSPEGRERTTCTVEMGQMHVNTCTSH